ncbi:MAG TPA: hypothetical protein VEV38_02090 [Candidatus Eremiobacteraceae bacterium]|nr:hypothetical protein [Candidatus Eremiobacteraceae bacterium]
MDELLEPQSSSSGWSKSHTDDRTSTSAQEHFWTEVYSAYQRTRIKFEGWAEDQTYKPYVVPPATAPNIGFTIFYTPPAFEAPLLIIGLNPSNFAGSRDLTAIPNAAMLSGSPPDVNSYLAHKHEFALALQKGFANRATLLDHSVGMNLWYYQCTSGAIKAPILLRRHCEETTQVLVSAMRPRHVLCFAKQAFEKIAGGGVQVPRAITALKGASGDVVFWYVAHPTGSWTRGDAEHDLPIVLSHITD